jgi:hypothetical protein
VRQVRRVCFTASPQHWLAGFANGESVLAVPDTGSEICLISQEHAEKQGYRVDTRSHHRKRLEFVDGSIGVTLGLVEDFSWQFAGTDCASHYPDVYVLEGLSTDLLLSFDFLWTLKHSRLTTIPSYVSMTMSQKWLTPG